MSMAFQTIFTILAIVTTLQGNRTEFYGVLGYIRDLREEPIGLHNMISEVVYTPHKVSRDTKYKQKPNHTE